jgi:hypothetical protein
VQISAIAYRNGKLKACEQDDMWTVRLANLETRASYLDLALAELLGNALEAHRVAARLLTELADVVEQQEAAYPYVVPVPPGQQRGAPRHKAWAKPTLLGLRVVVLAMVASTAFLLTTWLSTLR